MEVKTRERVAYGLGLAVLVLIFVRPYPVRYIGDFGVRFIDLTLMALVLLPLLISRDRASDRRLLTAASIALAFSTYALTTACVSVYRGVSWPEPRDVFESLRYAQYIPYILFGHFLARHPRFLGRDLGASLCVVLAASVAFSFAQKYVPDAVSELANFYSPLRQIESARATRRVMSFFGNPNTNGVMTTALGLAPAAIALSVSRSSSIPRRQRFALVLPLLALTASAAWVVLFSGSRTAFVTLLMVVVLAPICLGHMAFIVAGVALLGLAMLLREAIVSFVATQNRYLADGVDVILRFDPEALSTFGTFYQRFAHWDEALAFFQDSPLLGAGPLRSRIGSSTDNFYIYLLCRYGLIGLGAAVFTWGFIVRIGRHLYRDADPSSKFIGMLGVCLTLTIMVANLTIEAQIIPQIATYYFTIIGALMAAATRKESEARIDPL